MTDIIDVRRTLFAQSRYLDSHAISTSSQGKSALGTRLTLFVVWTQSGAMTEVGRGGGVG